MSLYFFNRGTIDSSVADIDGCVDICIHLHSTTQALGCCLS